MHNNFFLLILDWWCRWWTVTVDAVVYTFLWSRFKFGNF